MVEYGLQGDEHDYDGRWMIVCVFVCVCVCVCVCARVCACAVGHPSIQPADFVEKEVTGLYAKDYMFMACVEYIHTVSVLCILYPHCECLV